MEQYFTYRELKMMNGETLNHTLAFIRLNQVKAKHPEMFKRYCDIRNANEVTELDYCTLLYIAYLCANLDEEKVLSEEEYLNILPSNRKTIIGMAVEMTYPSKN